MASAADSAGHWLHRPRLGRDVVDAHLVAGVGGVREQDQAIVRRVDDHRTAIDVVERIGAAGRVAQIGHGVRCLVPAEEVIVALHLVHIAGQEILGGRHLVDRLGSQLGVGTHRVPCFADWIPRVDALGSAVTRAPRSGSCESEELAPLLDEPRGVVRVRGRGPAVGVVLLIDRVGRAGRRLRLDHPLRRRGIEIDGVRPRCPRSRRALPRQRGT